MPNRPRKSYNPKRALAVEKPVPAELRAMAYKVRYNGNPEHKSSPGDGVPLEAQLDNQDAGTYHGYPMPEDDPLRVSVLEAWRVDEQP